MKNKIKTTTKTSGIENKINQQNKYTVASRTFTTKITKKKQKKKLKIYYVFI